jgi:hypothetical protein
LYEEEVGGIDGVRVYRNAPSVSHLLFADDSLILMRADMTNATSLQQVLDTYCATHDKWRVYQNQVSSSHLIPM